jgi:hypothetical protein
MQVGEEHALNLSVFCCRIATAAAGQTTAFATAPAAPIVLGSRRRIAALKSVITSPMGKTSMNVHPALISGFRYISRNVSRCSSWTTVANSIFLVVAFPRKHAEKARSCRWSSTRNRNRSGRPRGSIERRSSDASRKRVNGSSVSSRPILEETSPCNCRLVHCAAAEITHTMQVGVEEHALDFSVSHRQQQRAERFLARPKR